jgi:hypothetical protein
MVRIPLVSRVNPTFRLGNKKEGTSDAPKRTLGKKTKKNIGKEDDSHVGLRQKVRKII